MAARPRSIARRGWPTGLKMPRPGYYSFSWTENGKQREKAIGKVSLAEAKAQAMEANILLTEQSNKLRLADKIAGKETTVSEYLDAYMEKVEASQLAGNTKRTKRSHAKLVASHIGKLAVARVAVRDVAGMVESITHSGRARTAQAIRSFAIDLFAQAAAAGLCERNPASVTRAPVVSVQRSRLTLEAFQTVFNHAVLPWQRNSMALAIVTAQSLQEVADMTFQDVRDGFLWCRRTKTNLHIKLPLSLTVPGLGWNLADVIRGCRDNVVSRYLVHHDRNSTMAKPGDPVHQNTISKGFRRARIAAGVGGEHPPTFHEIRSLALRLYGDKYGKDFAQSLAGHKDSATTAVYLDVRGAEWLEVKFGG